MKRYPVKVQSVQAGSIAEEAEIECGDTILAINDQEVLDVLDYRFLSADEILTIEIEKPDGECWSIDIEKDENEDLGITLEDLTCDDIKSCQNKCIFCFIDQLPKGLRSTLYIKDDDVKFSFLTGTYITLTNLSDFEIDRIIRYKISPINISVHTTNPDLRVLMLKNKRAGDIMKIMKRLAKASITLNCQIVLVRGVNDGDELDRTILELGSLYPAINSISVVPVGLTKYREGLSCLTPFDKDSASQVVTQVKGWQENLLKKHGSRIVFLADELYIMSDSEIPQYEEYQDFPQIENGVGMISAFMREAEDYISKLDNKLPKKRSVSIATGTSSYKFIKKIAKMLEDKYNNLNVHVYAILNSFFGETVTVTGLLTGGDLLKQLSRKTLGEELLIGKSMLKFDDTVFLDDWTVEDVSKRLGVPIKVVENDGEDFVKKILGDR